MDRLNLTCAPLPIDEARSTNNGALARLASMWSIGMGFADAA